MNLAQPDQSTQVGEYLVSYLYITSISSTPSHLLFIFRSGLEGLRQDYTLPAMHPGM